MKRFATLCVLVALAVLSTAQLGQLTDPQKMMAVPMMMLQHASVQKELKLTGAQKSEIKKVAEEATKSMQGINVGNDMAAGMAAMKQFNESMDAANAKVIAVLDEAQRARFQQVRYQVLGAKALGEAEVQSALALTDEQKQAYKDYEKAESAAFLNSARSGPSAIEKHTKGREKREIEFLKILTPEQSAKLKALYGAEFKDVKKVQGGR